MTGTVRLTPMRWWHLDDVHRLEVRLFPDDAWSLEQFWQELAQPTRRYLVAVDGASVVGYAGMFIAEPDADIQTVGVDPNRQGEGIARGLLEELLAVAEHGGVTHTLLEVRADNEPARALYDRLGFERISQRPRYYADGGDALILRRARPRHSDAGEVDRDR